MGAHRAQIRLVSKYESKYTGNKLNQATTLYNLVHSHSTRGSPQIDSRPVQTHVSQFSLLLSH